MEYCDVRDLAHFGPSPYWGKTVFQNQELVSSLVTDFVRTSRESPRVERPNAIVVSGDLVEGLPFGSEAYPEGLTRQYQEVADLLADLSDEFLSGDRSQLVIVPGNHDRRLERSTRLFRG